MKTAFASADIVSAAPGRRKRGASGGGARGEVERRALDRAQPPLSCGIGSGAAGCSGAFTAGQAGARARHDELRDGGG